MTDLTADTAVRALGAGRFVAEIAPGWRGGGGPHGGYIAAMLMRALLAGLDDPARSPRSLTVHFPRPPADGPVEIRVRVERAGRSLATLSARMEQGGETVALALAAFSPPWEAPAFDDATAPVVAEPADVVPIEHQPGVMPDFFAHVESRPVVGDGSWGGSAEAATGGWMRVRPPQAVDAPTAAFLLDAWWPAVFMRLGQPAGVPTVDLTVHFRRALPIPGAGGDDFVLGRFRTRLLHDGFLEEDGELWSRDGLLLAQSRQLALLRVPRS